MKTFFKNYKNIILPICGVVCVVALAAILILAHKSDTSDSTDKGSKQSLSQAEEIANNKNDSSKDDAISSNTEDTSSEEPNEETKEEPIAPLTLNSLSSNDITVSTSIIAISGASDSRCPLTLNGKEVERLETGEFSFDVELAPGNNNFKFEYNGKTYDYIVRYNFTVIKAYAPYEKQTYEAGSSFIVVALARIDSSSVKATFNGKTINLTKQPYNEGEEFTNFTGSFTLPTGNESNINLGGVKFTATAGGLTRSYTSPSIICQRDKVFDKPQIVEIVASQAETFNGDTTDDWSRPTNSYLPKGTLDYKESGIVYDSDSGNNYYKLRCGKRVYISKKNAPDPERVTVSKVYQGTLPDYNVISVAESTTEEKHSYITFDTAWKAPFAVTLAPQSYNNPKYQDYSISAATFTYVDIKFFYTKGIGGELKLDNHPLFASSQVISGENGYILRLHLKKEAAFYGWNAEYNEKGQLVFEFLNPPQIYSKNDLTGIKIVIDAGHGGRDPGAEGVSGGKIESERNLSLAFKLKSELERYGATVIMTRTSDISMSADSRCEFLRKQAPDLCISIHHDSNYSSRPNGASVFSGTPFSNHVMNLIYNKTVQTGLYQNHKKGWHYFYMARVTSCPVVLTENGFMSNLQDCEIIANDALNTKKAKAIAQGVLDYFNDYIGKKSEDDDVIGPNAPIVPIEPIEPPVPIEPIEPVEPTEPPKTDEPTEPDQNN